MLQKPIAERAASNPGGLLVQQILPCPDHITITTSRSRPSAAWPACGLLSLLLQHSERYDIDGEPPKRPSGPLWPGAVKVGWAIVCQHRALTAWSDR